MVHHRTWHWDSQKINIRDQVSGDKIEKKSNEAFFHFHPTIDVQIIETCTVKAGSIDIHLSPDAFCQLEEYDYAMGFNHTTKSTVLKVIFSDKLETIISLYEKNEKLFSN